MTDSQASLRYARALFALAEEQNVLDEVYTDFEGVCKVISEHPEILHLVLNSSISKKDKEASLDRLFGKGANQLLLQFLKVLVKKSRFKEIIFIQKEFDRLYKDKAGIAEVKVRSAVALSKGTVEKLTKALHKKYSKEIRLQQEVDESLLGGFVLNFGNQQINASYKERLLEIKQQLLA